jgi:hypothetical protein
MAIRIQIRRDTAANWTSSNPVLRAGEFGVETDTLKFKIGNGTSTWTQITTYANVTPTGLSNSLGDYILSADQGNAGGPAELDSNGDLIVPENSIILWNDAEHDYTTTLTATEPTADRTITFKNADGTVAFTTDIPATTDSLSEGTTNKYFSAELAQDATADALAAGTHTNITVTYNDAANSISLAAAPGYVDEQAVDAVAAALAAGTHTNITVGYNDEGNAISLTGAVTYTDENAQDAVGNAVGTGLSYNDTTGAISVDTTAIQARVADVSDTEIGYLNGVTSAIQTQLNDKLASTTASTTYAPIASPTFTGTVTLPGDPSSSLHAATKQYVDNTASGVVAKPQVLGATTANIDATYNNGTAGVGATLTHNTNGAFPAEAAGASGWAVGKGILVKNQTNKEENGRYYISNMGSPSTPYVLTRCGYCDEASEIPGAYIFVQDGTNAGTGWIQTVADAATFVVGTDDINVYQFSGSGTYTAGTGLTLTGNEYSINTSVTADLSTAQTLTNKTLTSPKINEDVAVTATATELNVLDGITASTSELNILDGATLSTTELNYVDGVTSSIQTQLGGKVSKAGGDTITNPSTTTVPLTIQTVNLNSADFMQFVRSDGFVQARITPNGEYFTPLGIKTGQHISTLNNVTFNAMSLPDGYTTLPTFVIQAAPSQTSALLQWRSSSGTVIASVNSSGQFVGDGSQLTGIDGLPSQSGNSGEYLTTDGTTASWAAIPVTSAATRTTSGTVLGYTDVSTTNFNVSIGQNSGPVTPSTSNVSNVSLGVYANGSITNGNSNTAIGTSSFAQNASGIGNTGVGGWSGYSNVGGSYNVFLGHYAGTGNESGSNNIIVGNQASASSSTVSNEITLGNSSITRFRIPGLGIDWTKAPIVQGTATVTANTATTIDTNALNAFTSAEYVVSLKQGSKVRTSKVIVQTDGTSVDMTEFAITETGGVMSGVAISAAVSSTNAVLQVTVTDAATTNVTVKFSEIRL